MAKKSSPTTTDDKLDAILKHLTNLDKRDRLRTWGGFFRSLIGLIPTLAIIWSLWYMYQHGDEVLAKIAKQAAEQAAAVTQQGAGSMMEQLQQMMGN